MSDKIPDKTPAEKTITVVVQEKILHSGTIYAEGSEITDKPESLQAALDTGKVKDKAKK
jgi:hypothetical protein